MVDIIYVNFCVFMAALLVSFSSMANAPSASRVALVIGNGAYKESPLKNPVNDAQDMAKLLKAKNFKVVYRSNLKVDQIGSTLREFKSLLEPGATAVVFYAGHGLQIKDQNYLPAVDAEISVEEDVRIQSMSVKNILNILDESKTALNLVFLDACRNNPYARSFRSVNTGGLARVEAPIGTLISFATRPGGVASDGGARNGLYTEQLLKQLESSTLPLESVLKQVVSNVRRVSGGKQEPWFEGVLDGEFYFNETNIEAQKLALRQPVQSDVQSTIPIADAGISTPATVAPSNLEDQLWTVVLSENKRKGFEVYLAAYPNGRYVELAKLKLDSKESSSNKGNLSVGATGERVQSHDSKEPVKAEGFKYLLDYIKDFTAGTSTSNVEPQKVAKPELLSSTDETNNPDVVELVKDLFSKFRASLVDSSQASEASSKPTFSQD